MAKAIVGVIGGSGVYDLEGLTDLRRGFHRPGASRPTRCALAKSARRKRCSCRAMAAAISRPPPRSITAPISMP